MNNLIILGAGATQIPLIETAKKMGYHTIVITIPGDYPGIAYGDEISYVDTTDSDGVLKVATEKKIVGICTTGTDVAVKSIGYINDKLGLSGITYNSSILVTDKAKMKQAMTEHGVRTAAFKKVYSVQEANEAASIIGYPVMLKCTDQAASKGITKVNSANEVNTAFSYATEKSRNPYIVVEKYIDGIEHGLDGYYVDETNYTFFIHGKVTKNNGVTNIPLGHYLPFECSDDIREDIIHQAVLACSALKLNKCFVNIDFILSDNQCYIIEVGGRTGATCIPDLISLYCGYNYYEKIIQNATGSIPDMRYHPQCACFAKILVSERGGTLTRANSDKVNLMENVTCFMDKHIGENIPSFVVGTDRYGHIISSGKCIDDAREQWEYAKLILNVGIDYHDGVKIMRLAQEDYSEIVAYLYETDKIYPVPMSKRVNIEDHAQKLLDKGIVIVAKYKCRIIGILLGYANDHVNCRGYLATLGVSEGYRSMGIGARLTHEMIQYAIESGMKYVGLNTHRDNKNAIRFYQKNGFKITYEENKPYPESLYMTVRLQ